jgi:predicted PurR-regulated permease PerM
MSRLISFAVLIAIIIFIGLLFYKVLIGFFIPVFLAAVLVVVFRPLHQWVLEKTGHRDQLAAAATTGLIMLCLFLPIALVLSAATAQGLALTEKNNREVFQLRFNTVMARLNLDMPDYIDELRDAENAIQSIVEESGSLSTQDDPALIQVGQAAKIALLALRAKVQPEAVTTEEADDETTSPNSPATDSGGEPPTTPNTNEVSSESGAVDGGIDESDSNNAIVSPPEEQLADPDVDDSDADPFDRLLALVERVGLAVDSKDGDLLHPIAVDIKSQFVDLKTKLLGGPFWAFARETANPTTDEREAWTEKLIEYVRPRLLTITGATGSFVIKFAFGLVITVVATFFFLYDGPSMLKTIMRLSPLDDAYEQELLLEFDRISRAVVLATMLSAIAQGLTAGLGYAVAGMDFLILLIMLTTVFAMVPFVGPAVVWIPVCLYIGVYEGRYLAAIVLACWGVLVVGTIDNLVKALVLHGQSQLHPLLALLSVLGGVQTLGPIGIVVGPMVVAMLQTLLSILQRELIHFDKQNMVVNSGEFTSQRKKATSSAKVIKPKVSSETPGKDPAK